MPYVSPDIDACVFGRLTARHPTGEKKRNSYVWKLDCVCGNTVERTVSDLLKSEKKNAVQSCGCYQWKELDMNKLYGYLRPLGRLERDGNRGFLWKFQCLCGNIIVKNGAQVARGFGALHCGCKKLRGGNNKHDLTNQTFGSLQVYRYDGLDRRGQAKWLCACDCGKLLSIRGSYLRRGKSHCGCMRASGKTSPSYKGGFQDIYQSYWRRVERGAQQRNLEFSVSIEDAWSCFDYQNGRCALSGIDITLGAPGKMTASLDRKNSNLGYIVENIQWIHKVLNKIKMDLQDDEFVEWCGRVWNYRIGALD